MFKTIIGKRKEKEIKKTLEQRNSLFFQKQENVLQLMKEIKEMIDLHSYFANSCSYGGFSKARKTAELVFYNSYEKNLSYARHLMFQSLSFNKVEKETEDLPESFHWEVDSKEVKRYLEDPQQQEIVKFSIEGIDPLIKLLESEKDDAQMNMIFFQNRWVFEKIKYTVASAVSDSESLSSETIRDIFEQLTKLETEAQRRKQEITDKNNILYAAKVGLILNKELIQ